MGCGTCAGVCPNSAIEMYISSSNGIYLPKIKEDKCTQCTLCTKVCPDSIDFKELNLKFFGKQPEDTLIGNYLGCYIGHSTDQGIRYNSSSGGVVTQLLIFALESGIIDGALVTRMKQNSPLEPEPFIARTKNEIIAASKSKYCPVALNVALKELQVENGKFAVVGLPCHIRGIRKAETIFRGLEKKIVLHIGLLCSHTVNFIGTEFLLKKIGVKKEDVVKIDYRGNGWPGLMSIQVRDGRNLTMPFTGGWNAYWSIFSSFLFTPMYCTLCSDLFNEFSDISLGDAWLKELKHEKVGESVIITRTPIADEILSLMETAGMISVKKIHHRKVKESQAFSLYFKKGNFSERLSLLKMFSKRVPDNSLKSNSHFLSLLAAPLPYISIRISSGKHLRSILLRIPLPLFRIYFGLFKSVFLLSGYLKG
jgi:coenzyme F420 hydrogenase subunit beta